MLTVITPATNRKLTTVSNLRLDLGYGPTQPSDAVLNRLIDVASSAIETYCNRVFARERVRETFDCVAGEDYILLERYPVHEFFELSVDGEIYDPTLYQNDKGFLYRLDEDGHRVPWGGGAFSVEYSGGYGLPSDDPALPGEQLPFAIQSAVAAEIAAKQAQQGRDPLVRSESEEGVGSTSWFAGGGLSSSSSSGGLLNPSAAAALDAYRWIPV